MEARQLFVPFASPAPTVAVAAPTTLCSATLLPIDGVLSFGQGIPPVTLTQEAVFVGNCPPSIQTAAPIIIANSGISSDETSDGPQFSDFRDPFAASTFPVCYALAATTVIAYMLVIMLFITPRSFLDGGIVYLGRRGFTNPSTPGVNIGGRPWLQKVAAMTVAISLTIATADTFRVAERQYSWGVQKAQELQLEVMDGTELKVIRLISDTFLWLAQAQTLIRLFPRQREKVIIKWTAFALITLDVIFSALNSFQYNTGSNGNARPRSFVDAIPALSYLFQLSLGLLYAAWVIYYSLMKKRYAFYHPLMKNITLVAALSLFSILVPVVFFVLDISKPEFTGWGDYVRWVGAAAASVVVWEWVERIEALEREEKKNGILGREVFDGDEMLEVTAAEFPWLRRKNRKNYEDAANAAHGGPSVDMGGAGNGSSGGRLNLWPGMSSIARYRGNNNNQNQTLPQTQNEPRPTTTRPAAAAQRGVGGLLRPPLWPSRPPVAASPVSRTDTASADSTVYAVRYHPISEATRSPEPPALAGPVPLSRTNSVRSDDSDDDEHAIVAPVPAPRSAAVLDPEANDETQTKSRSRWRTLAHGANPLFRRGAKDPPAEVLPHTNRPPPENTDRDDANRWDFRSRFEDFAVTQAEKIRERMRATPETDSLPVTVIPAPPRRGAVLARLIEEDEQTQQRTSSSSGQQPTNSHTTLWTSPNTSLSNSLERNTSNLSSRTRAYSQSQDSRPPLWPGGTTAVDRSVDFRISSSSINRRPADDPGSLPPPPSS
jgi:hypothetical protein